MISMTDVELDQIEREAEGYQLEDFPVTGVQVKAIIDRLRRAERAAEIMTPYLRYYMDKNRLKRANEAWAFTRAGVALLAVVVGTTATGLTGTFQKMIEEPGIASVGFVLLTIMIGSGAIMFPLMNWIDRTQNKRLLDGRYDNDPVDRAEAHAARAAVKARKLDRSEAQVATYAKFYGSKPEGK